MKSILLTSTALVAFAGAAFADGHSANDGISFTGDATLGHNDNELAAGVATDNNGFYWDANVAVTMSKALDNGVTAAATFDFDIADMNNGQPLKSGNYVLALTSESANLFYGDTSFAAESAWSSAGDMEADGFSENDGSTNLRAEATFGDVTTMASYNIGTSNVSGDVIANQLSVGATGSFGNFNFAAAYQEEADINVTAPNGDFKASEVYGLSGSTTVSGAEVTVAYANNKNADTTSTGVKIAYPFGPVTATAYYVMEDMGAAAKAAVLLADPANKTDEDNFGVKISYSAGAAAVALDFQDDQGVSKTAIDGSYDLGNGLEMFAGMYMEDGIENEFYVAGAYDLGGGASVLVAFADAEDDKDDEVGANEYQQGTTVEVSFAF